MAYQVIFLWFPTRACSLHITSSNAFHRFSLLGPCTHQCSLTCILYILAQSFSLLDIMYNINAFDYAIVLGSCSGCFYRSWTHFISWCIVSALPVGEKLYAERYAASAGQIMQEKQEELHWRYLRNGESKSLMILCLFTFLTKTSEKNSDM